MGAPANSPSLGFPIEIRVSIAENDFPQGLMNIDPGPVREITCSGAKNNEYTLCVVHVILCVNK